METTRALEQQVHRGEIGHHHVEVNVEGLLKHLSTDHHQPLRTIRRLPTEQPDEFRLAPRAIGGDEAAVSQHHVVAEEVAKRGMDVLGTGHGVADDGGAAAVHQRGRKQRGKVAQLVGQRPDADR
jgi:hypothetical protein